MHVCVYRRNMRVRRSVSLFQPVQCRAEMVSAYSVCEHDLDRPRITTSISSSDWAALTAANSCVCKDFYLSGSSKWLFLCTKWAGQSEGPHPFCWCPLPEPKSALWTHIHLKQPCFYSFGCNWPVLVSLPHRTGTKKVTECLRGKLIFLPPFTGLFVWLHMLNGAFYFSRLLSVPHISRICLQFE